MTNELIVFSHNDLDMAGSVLNIEYALPNIPKKYFYTNYGDIKDKVNEIEEYIKQHGNKTCLMTDISWSTSPDELHRLCNMFENIQLIDHHLYSDGFFNNYPKLKVLWDKSRSGALLTADYMRNNGKCASLDEITHLTDIYDLWQSEHPDFDRAQDLNILFWEVGKEKFINDFINSGFNYPFYYNDVVKSVKDRYTADIAKFENRKLIHRSDKITIAFVDEWFNQILIDEMKKGKDVVINAMSYGIFKIRISHNANITDDKKNQLRLKLTGTTDIGHMNAFSYKIKTSTSFDNIMKEIKYIIDNINEICYS